MQLRCIFNLYVDCATGSQHGCCVLRVFFIFMLFMSHLAASNCCALNAHTRTVSCLICVAEQCEARESGCRHECHTHSHCPSDEQKASMPLDDIETANSAPLETTFDWATYFRLIVFACQENLVSPPEASREIPGMERRWQFITRATGWSRAPSCPVA